MKDTVILGIGNLLRKDDGVGVHTIQQLQKEVLPENVELVDGGTGGLDLLGYFMDFPRIIVIDALKGDNPPGTVYKISPEDIPDYQKSNLSLHEVQVMDVIQICKLSGHSPQVTILGVEPDNIGYGLDLSDQIRSQIPRIIELIKKELGIINPNTIHQKE